MKRHQLLVLVQAQPGRKADLLRWYEQDHLRDILAVPGVLAGQVHDIEIVKSARDDIPQWDLMVQYVLEADDPNTVLAEITRRRQSGELVWTEALFGETTTQIVVDAIPVQTRAPGPT